MATNFDGPAPPDSLPKYLYEPLQRQDDIETLRDAREYIDALIEYQLHRPPEEDSEMSEMVGKRETAEGTVFYYKKKQLCGKDCGGCPHGPYLWKVQRSPDGSESWTCLRNVGEYH